MFSQKQTDTAVIVSVHSTNENHDLLLFHHSVIVSYQMSISKSDRLPPDAVLLDMIFCTCLKSANKGLQDE